MPKSLKTTGNKIVNDRSKLLQVQESDDMAEIFIYDMIGRDPWTGEGIDAQGFIDQLRGIDDSKPLLVRINSPGGSVFDGFTIYNLLSNRSGDVHVVVDGLAASIASIIAMAGDSIEIAENASFMIHDPMAGSAFGHGNSRDLRQLAEETNKTADLLDQIKLQGVEVYASRTGGDPDEIGDMMAAETWFSGSEAVKAGFADKVTKNKRVAASFDLSHFKNPPAWACSVDAIHGTVTNENRQRQRDQSQKLQAAALLRLAKRKLELTQQRQRA